MDDAGEIERFYDRCSDLMRELLDALAAAPDHPRVFAEIEDALSWPRRRIASVLGGVWHLRTVEFGGRRPYRFLDERQSGSGRWEMWMNSSGSTGPRNSACRGDCTSGEGRTERLVLMVATRLGVRRLSSWRLAPRGGPERR